MAVSPAVGHGGKPLVRRLVTAVLALLSGQITLAQDTARPALPASPLAALSPPTHAIARGQYLADAGNCTSCHSRAGAAPFSGGVPFETPFGMIYSTNITPDMETGIGGWTANDLRRAMHEGIAADGRRLFPAFPYTSFTKVTDEDVAAIYAYLRTLKPVHYTPPSNGPLFSQRWPLRLWNAMYLDEGRFVPDASRPAEWNRGAYLVQGLGHCGACHSPRNALMAESTDRPLDGGLLKDRVSANRIRSWSAVSLTSSQTGLAAWTVADITKYLNTGFCARAGTFGPMNEVIVNSTSKLSVDDARAIAVYLKSLRAGDVTGVGVPRDLVVAGQQIYGERCKKCHSASGRGGMFGGPPLAASAVVQADNASSLINVILYGPETPKDVSFGAWETMPSYYDVLNNEQVAAVSNYVRGTWGNRARPVRSEDVALQR